MEYKYSELYAEAEAADDVPCRDIPDIFFPEDFPAGNLRRQAETMAKNLCQQCPIMMQCLLYAITNNETYGVWGGTLPNER